MSPHIDAVHAGLALLALHIFLAAGWFRAAAEKLIDADWWRGAKLREFLDVQQGAQLPYFEPIAEHVIGPFATQVAVNVVFIMMGRVNPSAFYLFMEVALLYGISVGTIGHMRSRRSIRPLTTLTALLLLAATQIPFIRTIEPAEVIDDPAMMLTFLCLAATATTLLRLTRHHTISSASRWNLRPLWSLLLCRPQWSLANSLAEPRRVHAPATEFASHDERDR